MANEELTIAKEKARLTVIGNSYPDALTDSGLGFDLSQIIFDILIDLDIPMPDIDLDDLDDITIIPGLDIDTEIPTLEYPDPDWPDDEIPPIIDWPMPDLDWDDFIDKLEDLDLDPDILKDLSFVGLNDLEIPELVFLDEDFNIQMDELPASIEIVTPPNKLEYQDGERIDLTGMVVTAKKADGSTWTSAKYPNGHIPLGELMISPLVLMCESADVSSSPYLRESGIDADYVVSQDCSDKVCGYQYTDYGVARESILGYAENSLAQHSVQMKAFAIVTDDNYYLLCCWATEDGSVFRGGTPGKYQIRNFEEGTPSGTTLKNLGQNRIIGSIDGKYVEVAVSYDIHVYIGNAPIVLQNYVPTVYIGTETAIHSPSGLTNTQKHVAAWTLFFGEKIEGKKIITDNNISVSWRRPSDAQVLSTSFTARTNPVSGNGGR